MDTARFRRRLAERYGVAPENVHAYIIGEHGDSQVPVVSSARIAGVPLGDFCHQFGLPYEGDALTTIENETRKAGFEIIHAKGATYYGIGAALVRIVGAILRDEHAVLTVSNLAPSSMDFGEVFLSPKLTSEFVAQHYRRKDDQELSGPLETEMPTLRGNDFVAGLEDLYEFLIAARNLRHGRVAGDPLTAPVNQRIPEAGPTNSEADEARNR